MASSLFTGNDSLQEEEQSVPFDCPDAGIPCFTWYKITRSAETSSKESRRPLILIHGGPGSCHEYLSPFTDLCSLADMPVISYDQIGGGASTRLPHKAGDRTFWTGELFVGQLAQLVHHLQSARGITEYDILGHSWGGVLASRFAARRPAGLRRLILASAPASSTRMIEGVKELLAQMPADIRETIEECDAAGDYDNPAYNAACDVFAAKHFFPWTGDRKPADMKKAAVHKGETSVYMDTWGPSEVGVVGTLKDWDTSVECRDIQVPTLVYRGELDEITDHSVRPFVQGIPNVKGHVIRGAMHFAHWEKREECMKICAEFLTQ